MTIDTTTISIRSKLVYEIEAPTAFAFAITAARSDHQRVVEEDVDVAPGIDYEFDPYGEGGHHQLLRLAAEPGPLEIEYRALVELRIESDAPEDLQEVPFQRLPSETLPYLSPSRYCESDQLGDLAFRLFGHLDPGYERVRAISSWVRENIDYVPGVTDASSDSSYVLTQRAGVCRDFAHVMITFCRALGIPARYIGGYGIGVEPQDFHGFCEVYLDRTWWLFDPTGMAKAGGLVRIGYGRDAADASFATLVGSAAFKAKRVEVEFADGDPGSGEVGSISAESTA